MTGPKSNGAGIRDVLLGLLVVLVLGTLALLVSGVLAILIFNTAGVGAWLGLGALPFKAAIGVGLLIVLLGSGLVNG